MSINKEAAISGVKERKRYPASVDMLVRLVKEKPLGVTGGVITLIAVFVAIFANQLAPYPNAVYEVNLAARLMPPSDTYFLGTDSLGRDLLSRVMFGARISMVVGLASPAIGLVLSTIIGGSCGFLGGKFDLIVQRFVDAWQAFPALILYMSVMALLGGGLFQVVIVLGVSGGIGGSRIIRSAVINIKEDMYVEAARAIGASPGRVFMKHILPNITPILIVAYSTTIAGSIMAEASLSFLGFGIPPPEPSWGGMLSGEARSYMLQAPWMAIWPGLALGVVVYGVNMLGDAIRDIQDPKLRGGLGRYGGISQEKLQKMIQKYRKK